jgi:hypothetical protein
MCHRHLLPASTKKKFEDEELGSFVPLDDFVAAYVYDRAMYACGFPDWLAFTPECHP